MIHSIEGLMYQLSDVFMAPVLVILVGLFIYSIFVLGAFLCQVWQRKVEQKQYWLVTSAPLDSEVSKHQRVLRGYPLVAIAQKKPSVTRDELDVASLEALEGVRTVSRLSPMLGLIATMIPMGPALKSLSDGNAQGISENLIVAFSAVIFGLVIASITFWIASIKKRWLACEIIALTPLLLKEESKPAVEVVHEAA